MQVYRGSITLMDYLFYATVERGKVYETGAFIHNYALTYALGLVRSSTYTYSQMVQEPRYVEELTPLNDVIYITPGSAVQTTYRLVQWNTLRESYAFPGKPPSLGYPDWGFARMVRPGSVFTFYVMVHEAHRLPDAPTINNLIAGRTAHVRLGKFQAKCRLKLEPASEVTEGLGQFNSETLLNWRDIDIDPVASDILVASLPTRLINHAYFAETWFVEAHFGAERIRLPRFMRYLARLPERKRRKGKT